MSVIRLHHDSFAGSSALSRLFSWLKTTHQAMVTAKLERLENELVFRRGYSELPSDREAMRYPQAPLVLSDKWDF
jgi:hypothetical protein